MNLDLIGKVALVAGSSRGIGRTTAEVFLEEGASVVITGRESDSLDRARSHLSAKHGPDRVLSVCGDLTRESAVDHAVAVATSQFGRLDIAVCNIGWGGQAKGLDTTDEEWLGSLRGNLVGGHLLIRRVVPEMKRVGGGSIVLISSIAGQEHLDLPAPVSYVCMKASVEAFGSVMAKQLAADNIRVNTVAPGNVIFPEGNWARKMTTDPAAVQQYIRASVPMRRLGAPEEIGWVVAFLASPRASFVTGTCVVVDGGQSRRLLR